MWGAGHFELGFAAARVCATPLAGADRLVMPRERMSEAGLDDLCEFRFGEPHFVGVGVFPLQRGVEHRGIVCGEDDGDPVTQ